MRLSLLGALFALPLPMLAAEIDRSIADFSTPAEIRWVRNAAGTNEQAILHGDPSKPGPAGSYVIHYANKVHYDGAKGEEVVIQAWGMGPATATPAERK